MHARSSAFKFYQSLHSQHTWNGLISRATTGPVCLLNLWTSESASETILAGSHMYSSPCSEPAISKPDAAVPRSMPYEPHTSLWNLHAQNINCSSTVSVQVHFTLWSSTVTWPTRGKVLSWEYRSQRKRNSRPPASATLCWVSWECITYLLCIKWFVGLFLDSNLHTRLAIVTENELGLAFPPRNLPKKFRPDPSTFYLVIVVTNRQTNKQTDRQTYAGDSIIPRESFCRDNKRKHASITKYSTT